MSDLVRASNDLVEQRILGVDQTWDRVWFVRVRSGCGIIRVTCEKLVKLGGFPRTGHSLSGREKLI